MTIAKSAIAAKRTRSVEWTAERIGALDTIGVRNLRANSERLNDLEIMRRCDAILAERKRASRLQAAKTGAAGAGRKPAAKASVVSKSA